MAGLRTIYDGYNRSGPKVFVGEYGAANGPVRTLKGAVAEAARYNGSSALRLGRKPREVVADLVFEAHDVNFVAPTFAKRDSRRQTARLETRQRRGC